jgi:hypothetical protein
MRLGWQSYNDQSDKNLEVPPYAHVRSRSDSVVDSVAEDTENTLVVELLRDLSLVRLD